jgi:mRNA deadenylase 3'-5' endonuclease subunit Ccr4
MSRGDENVATLRVVQFNTLAGSLCTAQSFPFSEGAALEWDVRKHRLLDTIFGLDPDLICLEEVDEDSYHNCFHPALLSRGFSSQFEKKKSANSADGCVVAWRSTMFACNIKDIVVHRFKDANQLALIVPLLHIASNQTLWLTATHLKAKRGFEETRTNQAKELIQALRARSPKDLVILCGDFNDEPSSQCYSYINSQELVPLHSCYARYHEWRDPQLSSTGVSLEEAPYTTYKQRDPLEITCRTIDYIWADPRLMVRSLVSLPEPLPEVPFPSVDYPSDHLLIGAILSFQSTI